MKMKLPYFTSEMHSVLWISFEVSSWDLIICMLESKIIWHKSMLEQAWRNSIKTRPYALWRPYIFKLLTLIKS